MKLSLAFRARLAADVTPPAEGAALEQRLERLVAEARAAWPEIAVAPEEFVAYVGERLPAGQDALAALDQLQAPDLLVACGCTAGDAGALAAFERHFMTRLAAYLQKADALPAFTDEVKQAVRVRLLVAEGGLRPRIASYRGQGPLGLWLRLAAARLAVDLRRQSQPAAGEDEIAGLHAPDADPELELFKAHYREELGRAVEAALRALPVKDANLLRLHFFEHLSADAIGALHGVSGRTVQRWIADIRARIVADTRAQLNQTFALSETQFASMVGLVQSQIDITLSRLLSPP